MVAWLDRQKVPYALVGGLAATLHGKTRVTEDVDIVIGRDVEQTLRLVPLLDAAVFEPLLDDFEPLLKSALLLPLHHRPTGVIVDLVLGVSGFEQDLVARARTVRVAGLDLAIASAEHLVVMKTIAGRPQDDQDIRGMLDVLAVEFDWNACLELARQLGKALDMDLEQAVQQYRSRPS